MPPEAPRLPDFIIGGAMKSGTTTLHYMLADQPDIFIPHEELFFFDIDDYEQHPEFFTDRSGRWVPQDFGSDGANHLEAYAQRFSLAPAGALLGEDSTTYLASRRASKRISRLLPAVRMVFLLRDPASRTYSQYWHLMRTGRATGSFEWMLRRRPGTLIQRSLYREQLARYLAAFPRDQLHVVAFERLVREPMRVLADVGRFLGRAEVHEVPSDALHRNRAQVPRLPALQRVVNRVRGGRSGSPLGRAPRSGQRHSGRRMQSTIRSAWFREGRVSPMRRDTRRFLNAMFRNENRGLDELLGASFEELWYRDG